MAVAAVCGSLLQSVAVYCSFWQSAAVFGSLLQSVAVCGCFFQSVAICAHFQVPENGTSSARIKKRRPLFHANTPPKWWTRYLFHVFTSKSDFWPFYWFWIFWLRFQLFLHCKRDQNFKWPYLDRLWVYNAGFFLCAPITQPHHISRRQDVTQKKSFCGTP